MRLRAIAMYFVGFAIIGVALLLTIRAATNTASTEPESGSLAGGAKSLIDSGASGGAGIQFANFGQPDVSGALAFGMNGSGAGNVWCIPQGCTEAEFLRRLDDVKTMGTKWIRLDFSWPSIQRTNDPNRSNWTWFGFDDAVQQAISRGITPVLTLDYTPSWTAGMTMQQRADAYATFAGGVAAHYKALGAGSEVKYFELGNEENLEYTWTDTNGNLYIPDTDFPEQVARKEHAAWAAIKGVDPSYLVLSTGLGNVGDIQPTDVPVPGTNSWTSVNFLRVFYAKLSTLGYNPDQTFDALAYHPYCNATSYPVRFSQVTAPGHYCAWYWMTYDTSANNIFTIMANNGDSGKRVWPTEVGVSTADWTNQTTAYQVQADSLTDAYTYVQQHANKFGPLFWYMYKDSSSSTTNHGGNYGMYTYGGSATAAGTPKTAYTTYNNLTP